MACDGKIGESIVIELQGTLQSTEFSSFQSLPLGKIEVLESVWNCFCV